MQACQRDAKGNLIPESCAHVAVAVVLDTSGRMGGYLPELVEDAVNAFFKQIASSQDADDLVHIAVFEAGGASPVLGAFDRASNLRLKQVRYGREWNVPEVINRAVRELKSYLARPHNRSYAWKHICLVVISDNPVPVLEVGTAMQFEEAFSFDDDSFDQHEIAHSCYLACGSKGFALGGMLAGCNVVQVENAELQAGLVMIAQKVVALAQPENLQTRRTVANARSWA